MKENETVRPLLIGVADTLPAADGVGVSVNYMRALYAAGHTAVLIPHLATGIHLRPLLAPLDLIVLPGGGADIAAWRFSQTQLPLSSTPNPVRDDFESALIAECRLMGKPLVGICRGLQILNVCLGGDLYQDISLMDASAPFATPEAVAPSLLQHFNATPPFPVAHQRPDKQWEGVHPITVDPASRLATACGLAPNLDVLPSLFVNSTHHQVLAHIAPGLRVTAIAPDGAVEAIEAENEPIAAVQFHPERLAWGSNTPFLHLFAHLDTFANPA